SGWSQRTLSAPSMSERNAASPRRRDVDMPCAASGLWMSSAAPSTALATSFDAYTTTTWWQPPFEAASIACLTIGWPSKSRSSFSVPPMRELEPAASTTAPTGSSDAARRSLEGRAARIHSTSAAAAVAALAKSCRRALSASMAILGAHVDSSGGLHNAFERAKAMDADAIQCHPTPPGFWGSPKLDETRIATFKEAADKYGHPPFYFHAVYLINLAGDDATLRQ